MADVAAAENRPIYDQLGGEAGLRRLTRRMYELMDTLPEAAECRAIHPPSLAGSEQKLFEFLSGWLGGPPLFEDRHGPPMLRRRHFIAEIGPAERDGWLACFEKALIETVADVRLRQALREPVHRMAFHMQNKN